ncbi:MAG: ligase-associated DNA damage response endonuclease PdeM [Flavobacterium sp.]|nr:MAG: ligase-associated DNA damage response endonuclease PdeM [Flavobacterium sp.]
MTVTRTISGHDFVFHPSGAIYWTTREILLIADVHLGKVTHFRKAGMAVPPESALENFHRFDLVEQFFNPKIIVFLGDLFHSELNSEWDNFKKWVSGNPAKIILIAGNHDIIKPEKYEKIGVHVFDEMTLGDFLFTHHPKERERVFNFCGHIHPAVRLRGKGKQWLTLPCFFHKPHQLILPAFGHFTGTYVLEPTQQDCVYAIAKDEVLVVCEN